MFNFNVYVLVAALAGVLVFLLLPIAWKVLTSFIVMSQGFDLLPQIVYGYLVWDVGAAMLLAAAIQLAFKRGSEPKLRAVSLTVLRIFIVWLILTLAYSVLVYGYPLVNSLKTSRHMIIGYLSIFIFLRLFQTDKKALTLFTKWLYILTYVLLILAVLQFISGTRIFYGLIIEYKGAVRYLPVFLPICLFYLWVILSKWFRGTIVKSHELVYGVLVFIVVATTYTRGIYLAGLISFIIMLFILEVRGRLKPSSAIVFAALMLVSVAAVIGSGVADRVIGRATSALDVLMAKRGTESDVDTFTGRLRLVEERMILVSDHNPFVGFGFLHEEDVSPSLRSRFRYGSVIYTPAMKEKYAGGHPYVLALYSADIGWANIVVNSGFVGSGLLLLFIVTLILSYKKENKIDPTFSNYRVAFFVETITLLLLMFNGNTFTNNVHIPAFMIGGYLYCNAKKRMEVDNPMRQRRYLRKPDHQPGAAYLQC